MKTDHCGLILGYERLTSRFRGLCKLVLVLQSMRVEGFDDVLQLWLRQFFRGLALTEPFAPSLVLFRPVAMCVPDMQRVDHRDDGGISDLLGLVVAEDPKAEIYCFSA